MNQCSRLSKLLIHRAHLAASWQLKAPGTDLDAAERSPKIVERKSPRSPTTEIAQLQEELNKARDQLSSETLKAVELTMAKATEEKLRTKTLKAMEAYKSMAAELEQSKSQVKSLEELVSKLQANIINYSSKQQQ